MVNANWVMNKMQSGQTMNETAFCPGGSGFHKSKGFSGQGKA